MPIKPKTIQVYDQFGASGALLRGWSCRSPVGAAGTQSILKPGKSRWNYIEHAGAMQEPASGALGAILEPRWSYRTLKMGVHANAPQKMGIDAHRKINFKHISRPKTYNGITSIEI